MNLLAGFVPLLYRCQNILLDIKVGSIDCRCTDDNSEVLWQNLCRYTTQTFLIVVRANLLRDKDL